MKTKVYVYGLRPPTREANLVDAVMRKAHDYKNAHKEIEIDRRTAQRAVVAACDDRLAPLLAAAQEIAAQVREAQAEIRTMRATARRRAETTEQRARLRGLRDQEDQVWGELWAARKKLPRTPDRDRDKERERQARREIDARAKERRIAIRPRNGELPWGTYQFVEQAMDQARQAPLWVFDEVQHRWRPSNPRFFRWERVGAVAVHIQNRVLQVADAMAGTDSWVRILLKDQVAPPTSKRQAQRRFGVVQLRIGTGEGRQPIWAEWPLLMHRPLPDGAEILWAVVHGKRIADHYRWELHLTVRVPEEAARRCGHGVVAVDVGWRKMNQGAMRVAFLRDDAGAEREIVLDLPGEREIQHMPAGVSAVVSGMRKVEDLASIRSQHQNAMIAALRAWMEHTRLPARFQEAAAGCAQWRSPRRFAALLHAWKGERWAGDEAGFALLAAWGAKDRHLWQWQEHQRQKCLRRRQDQYRRLAYDLASHYDTLVLEAFDKRETQKHTLVGSEEVEIQEARWQQRVAATSELCMALTQAFHARGGRVVKIDPAMTTQRCHACGYEGRWDAASQVDHTCEACGRTWDQDANAVRNMLALFQHAGGEEVATAPRPAKWAQRVRHKKFLPSGGEGEPSSV